jgi:hypothetical protein
MRSHSVPTCGRWMHSHSRLLPKGTVGHKATRSTISPRLRSIPTRSPERRADMHGHAPTPHPSAGVRAASADLSYQATASWPSGRWSLNLGTQSASPSDPMGAWE